MLPLSQFPWAHRMMLPGPTNRLTDRLTNKPTDRRTRPSHVFSKEDVDFYRSIQIRRPLPWCRRKLPIPSRADTQVEQSHWRRTERRQLTPPNRWLNRGACWARMKWKYDWVTDLWVMRVEQSHWSWMECQQLTPPKRRLTGGACWARMKGNHN